MKIIRCSQCGKYIHQANRCFHCGNNVGFDEVKMPSLHENIVVEYSRVESLIQNKKFSEAISLSYVVIEWAPNLSGIFWLRLLAKNKCTSAAELIVKGFSCEDDADFSNALIYSTGAEHSAYIDIQNMIISARDMLKDEILNHEHRCKMETNILNIKKNMQREMDIRKQTLFSLWIDLEKTEQALYALEIDCRLLSKEHRDALDKAVQAASTMKAETYRLKECSAENLYKYQVRIEHILQQSEKAKDAVLTTKEQHPWVKSFAELVSKRDEQVRLIGAELSSLRSYEATVQQTLSEIEKIEKRHREVIHEVEEYNFQNAATLLGNDCFNQLFHRVGLGVDVPRVVFTQNRWPTTTVSDSSAFEDDDTPAFEDDDYNMWDDDRAWGLT